MTNQAGFHWADYLVFALVLVISATIGLAFGYVDRKKKSSHHFLLGGGDLSVFPVGMSLLASFISAIAILGFSAEMYKFGSMYWIVLFANVFSQGLTALVYIPFFHKLGVTCAYEYLDIRFSHSVRLVTSVVFCLQTLLYMSVALYTPSLAIKQVTGIGLEISVIVTGLVCCLYTVVGGLKATVWIDTFQVLIMLSGLILIVSLKNRVDTLPLLWRKVIVKGTLKIGSIEEVYSRFSKKDRIDFFNFDPNPFIRHTFWTLFIGGCFNNLSVFGANQNSIQRYLSVKKWTDASKAMMINFVGYVFVLTLTCSCGVVMFAEYHECDLLSSGQVEKSEQILPFYVIELLGNLPGLPGLFIASVYSAALSTISASMNSLACVCITDFVRPGLVRMNIKLEEKVIGRVTKILALAFGLIGIGLAYLCQFLPGQVLQFSLSIFGLLGAPILGVISLGMFVPYANWIGALSGLLVSVSLNIWIGIGSILYVVPKTKPFSTSGCDPLLNLTLIENFNNATTTDDHLIIYDLSYLHYSTLALIVVFVVGIIVSFITQTAGFGNKKLEPKYYAFRFICCSSEHKKNRKVATKDNDFSPMNWYEAHLEEINSQKDKSEIVEEESTKTTTNSTNVQKRAHKDQEKFIKDDLNEIIAESTLF